MTFWKDFYLGTEQWTSWDHALVQHQQLLITGGHLCKVLFRNQSGDEVGTVETPIPISIWDLDSTSASPRKRIWKTGDDIELYPNPESVRVFVDGNELVKTYNYQTIQTSNEFYVEIQNNLIGYNDNVSIYLNPGFVTTGHSISYLYTTRSKSIDQYNLQIKDDTVKFRSPYGFTQYINGSSRYRGALAPNTILVSFPVPPPFDTRFSNFGAVEEWQNRGWTLGTPQLHEFDIIYRLSDGRFYEVRSWEPNILRYKNDWKILTQSFELTQLGPNDILRQFSLV